MRVLAVGVLTTVQDAGRPGYAHLGVPRAGAAAPSSAALANRLVGNAPDAALLESVAGGVDLSPTVDSVVAVTGAECRLVVDGRPRALRQPVHVHAGALVHVGPATLGLVSYVAVAGGVVCQPELGSRSTDTLAGLGPAPLRPGSLLEVGDPYGVPAWGDPAPDLWRRHLLRLHPGPRLDWLTTDAKAALVAGEWAVSADSNRIGMRLEGAPLERARHDELPSEGAVRGAVQVPPSGMPVIFGPDHPATGGYPVVAVVDADDLDACAQLRPGERVRLTWARPAQAGASGRPS